MIKLVMMTERQQRLLIVALEAQIYELKNSLIREVYPSYLEEFKQLKRKLRSQTRSLR